MCCHRTGSSRSFEHREGVKEPCLRSAEILPARFTLTLTLPQLTRDLVRCSASTDASRCLNEGRNAEESLLQVLALERESQRGRIPKKHVPPLVMSLSRQIGKVINDDSRKLAVLGEGIGVPPFFHSKCWNEPRDTETRIAFRRTSDGWW